MILLVLFPATRLIHAFQLEENKGQGYDKVYLIALHMHSIQVCVVVVKAVWWKGAVTENPTNTW